MVQLPTVSAEARASRPRRLRPLPRTPPPSSTRSCTSTSRSSRSPTWDCCTAGVGAATEIRCVLMAHYDVVPAVEDDGWTFPPFEGRIHDGSVHGRGTLDDKGPLLVLLEAVENLLADGFTLRATCTSPSAATRRATARRAAAIADLFRERRLTPWLVLDEGGAVVDAPLPFVKVPRGDGRRRREGRADAHASPPAATAATPPRRPPRPRPRRIARAVQRLSPNPFPKRMPRSMRTHARSLRSAHAAAARRLLLRTAHRAAVGDRAVFARLGGEPAALVHTTVAATMLEGGTAANVLPAHAAATLNLRIAVGETVQASATARVRRVIRDPPWPSRSSRAQRPFARVADRQRPVRGDRRRGRRGVPEATTAPYLMMAATDSRLVPPLLPRGLPVRPARDDRGAASGHPRGRRVGHDRQPRPRRALPPGAHHGVAGMSTSGVRIEVIRPTRVNPPAARRSHDDARCETRSRSPPSSASSRSSEFTSGILQGYYTPLLTDIARHLGIHDADVNWLEGTQLMLSALVVPAFAKLGDMVGHKRMLLWSTAITAVASTALAFTDQFWVFLVAWALQGFYVVWLPLEIALVWSRSRSADRPAAMTRKAAGLLVAASSSAPSRARSRPARWPTCCPCRCCSSCRRSPWSPASSWSGSA